MDPVKSFSFSPTLYQMLSISISISIHFIHYDLFLSILSITLPKHLPTPIIRKVLVIPFHKIYDSNRCDRIIVVIFWVMPDIFQLRVVAYYARASPRDATGCKNLTPLLIGWIEWVSEWAKRSTRWVSSSACCSWPRNACSVSSAHTVHGHTDHTVHRDEYIFCKFTHLISVTNTSVEFVKTFFCDNFETKILLV